MGAIMMDKSSIDTVITYLGGEFDYYQDHNEFFLKYQGDNYSPELCWDNFLTAIVLWDEIWHFQPEGYPWETMFMNQQIVDNMKRLVYTVSQEAIDKSLLGTFVSLTRRCSRTPLNIRNRTIGYQLISNSLGVPFLGHPRRATNLMDELLHFTRRDVIDRINKELIAYYNHINEELGRDLLKLKYPVLIDYIMSQADTPEEEMEAALSLRNEKYVVEFRKELNKIESLIKDGNTQKILSELKMVSDLANDITSQYSKKTIPGEFSISLSPSLSIPITLKTRNYGLHATFVRKLINHGVYGRR